MHFLHIANSDKPVTFYSLDVILAVGYRTNSVKTIDFRRWVSKVLKDYLLQGYAINERRLLEARHKFNQLQEAVTFLQRKSKFKTLEGQEQGILTLLADYSRTLTLLEQYDKNELKASKGKLSKLILSYKECLDIIVRIKEELLIRKEAGKLFGNEMDQRFESVVKNFVKFNSGKSDFPELRA